MSFARVVKMAKLALACLLTLYLACNCFPQHPQKIPKLLLISFDGFRPDYMSPEVMPFLYNLSKKGVLGTRMKPVFTTKTLPNHLSIATGLYEESHGMIGNVIYDPKLQDIFNYNSTESKWWDNGISDPIWIANEITLPESKRHSGVMMWPGGSAAYSGHLPTHLHVESIWSNISFQARADMVTEWLTHPTRPANLAVIYHNQPDFRAHDFGPFSREVRKELQIIDHHLKHLFTRLEQLNLLPELNIIILSDHGMSEVKRENLTVLSRIIDENLYDIYGDPPLYNLEPKKGQIDKVYSILQEKSHKHGFYVYKKEGIPDDFHFKKSNRIQSIIVYAKENYELIGNETEIGRFLTPIWGEHGYINDAESMRPFFLGLGPAFKSDYVYSNQFENIDVYPLMCKILDLPLERFTNNGTFGRIASVLKGY